MKRVKSSTCPNCGKEALWEGNPYRPFCSKRCKLIDLGEWASGKYRIPGPPVEKEDEREEAPESEKEKENS